MNTLEKGTNNLLNRQDLKKNILTMGVGTLEFWKRAILIDKILFNQLFSFIFSDNPKLAWRSCWIIDTASEEDPELMIDKIPEIISALSSTTNSSLKRHFTRILSRYQIPEIFQGTVIDQCFKLLGPTEPAAVRVNAMQVLFNLAKGLPDLKGELSSVLESLIDEGGSAGFINRAVKLIKQLRS